jgi:hypothetical protein
MICITTPVLTEGEAGRYYALNTIRCRVMNTVIEEGKGKNYEY